MTRPVVAAVLVLAAIAAADAFEVPGARDDQRPAAGSRSRIATIGSASRVSHGFQPVGAYLQTKVLRDGRLYLAEDAIDRAFPSPHEGPFDIADLAVASDGTIALAVYRFPADHPAEAAVELWRDRRLVGSFTVPAGSIAGGVDFSADGSLVLVTSADGKRTRAFTRGGYRAL